MGYVCSLFLYMAGILLAKHNSRIIGVMVNDHEVNDKEYFLMIKTTSDIRDCHGLHLQLLHVQ